MKILRVLIVSVFLSYSKIAAIGQSCSIKQFNGYIMHEFIIDSTGYSICPSDIIMFNDSSEIHIWPHSDLNQKYWDEYPTLRQFLGNREDYYRDIFEVDSSKSLMTNNIFRIKNGTSLTSNQFFSFFPHQKKIFIIYRFVGEVVVYKNISYDKRSEKDIITDCDCKVKRLFNYEEFAVLKKVTNITSLDDDDKRRLIVSESIVKSINLPICE
jgi:hypothetical protein